MSGLERDARKGISPRNLKPRVLALFIERIIRNERPTRLASVETSDSGRTAGIVMVAWDAPQGDTKGICNHPALFGVSSCEQKGRLGVAAGGGPFGRRTAIVLELEQSNAPWLSSVPCLELSAAELANLQLAIGVTAKTI